MTTIGLFLSSEEHGGRSLIDQARAGEEAGFGDVLISDHFHPWNDAQGQSPFVWSVVGAIAATTGMRITTGVTCPTVRTHPAVIAQAAATMGELSAGRFRLGVGSGEALNEHILGDSWPAIDVRLAMLEEAIEIMRTMWGGKSVTYRGRHYTVENARIYTLPDRPVEVLVSAFGPKAATVAARTGDGFVGTDPGGELLGRYRSEGGKGPGIGALKVCFGQEEAEARKLAHRLWANEQLPGELNQLLPTPAHFEQASTLVSVEMVAVAVPCGPDPERHIQAISKYLEAGYDEVYINQIGPDQAGFRDFFHKEVKPRLSL